jgi:hypothetical protein
MPPRGLQGKCQLMPGKKPPPALGGKGPPDESSESPQSWLKAGIWETEELQKTDSGVGEEPKT